MAGNRPAVSFTVQNCHECKQPATFTCKDCGKPICGQHMQIAMGAGLDGEKRCKAHYHEYVKKHGK